MYAPPPSSPPTLLKLSLFAESGQCGLEALEIHTLCQPRNKLTNWLATESDVLEEGVSEVVCVCVCECRMCV